MFTEQQENQSTWNRKEKEENYTGHIGYVTSILNVIKSY